MNLYPAEFWVFADSYGLADHAVKSGIGEHEPKRLFIVQKPMSEVVHDVVQGCSRGLRGCAREKVCKNPVYIALGGGILGKIPGDEAAQIGRCDTDPPSRFKASKTLG